MPQEDLLSESVLQEVVDKVDEDIDIPLVFGSWERKMLEIPIRKCNTFLKSALGECAAGAYIDCLSVLLDETIDSDEKIATINRTLDENVKPPLADYLTEKIHTPAPEDLENQLISHTLDHVMRAIVAGMVECFAQKPIEFKPKDDPERSREFGVGQPMPPSDQEDLLSEETIQKIVDKVDAAIDVPFVEGQWERQMIEAPVRAANGHLKDALGTFVPRDWQNCLELMLDSSKPPETRVTMISDVTDDLCREPVAVACNGQIDIPIIDEETEGKLFNKIVDHSLDAMVHHAVECLAGHGFGD